MGISQALFAAGCFWGIQAAFDAVPGVLSTSAGYTGGHTLNPNYETVCSDKTGHAEAVLIDFDEKIISYNELLNIFFSIHNPTTKNRQGPDVGSQYRSAVFYFNDAQKQAALKKIAELNQAEIYPAPIVTEVLPAATFYPAEEYHQKYLEKNNRKNCSFSPVSPSQELSSEEWKKRLSPEQYEVLRNRGTEKPFTGKYLNMKEDGTYTCAGCGNPIFSSDSKFNSGSGWPSFDKAIPGSVKLSPDFSHGMTRTEVTCSRCGSHLGHVFEDGPTDTGMRFCINSASMDFKSEKK